jgi:hypothetical protein
MRNLRIFSAPTQAAFQQNDGTQMSSLLDPSEYLGRLDLLVRTSSLTREWSNCMAHSINRFVLTPSESAAKALIVDQLRANPRGPWVNGKKMGLPASKGTTSLSNKKK